MRPHRRQSRRKATVIATGTPPEDITRALNGKDSDPAAMIVTRRLRELVDEWLETGRSSDGRESPNQRDLSKTAGALRAVEKCLAENPARLVFTRGTLGYLGGVSKMAVEIAAKPAPPPRPVHVKVPTGTATALGSLGSCYNDDDLREAYENFLRWMYPETATNPAPFQGDEADRLFTVLMLSDWKAELCRCRYAPCGQYFRWPDKKKLRPSYLHGTFCRREHQGSASATVYTNSFRTQAKPILIEVAAQQLLKKGITEWQKDANLKRRIAGVVSNEIKKKRLSGKRLSDYRKKVTVKWVSQNELAIEQERARLARGASSAAR